MASPLTRSSQLPKLIPLSARQNVDKYVDKCSKLWKSLKHSAKVEGENIWWAEDYEF